ncbi:hypothetical protein CVN86_24625 [Salmonella enterica]|nr:hypothetical protein [Salmonella enterica]
MAYQKKRAELEEARKNIPPKNPVDFGKQLAAARGEYVEGISDPNDPKYSASNKGEKTEIPQPNNDDRSQKFAEEKATDAPATMESLLHEIVRLQSINNQLLEVCAAYQERAETRNERFLEALFYGITRFAYQWVEGEEDLEFEEKIRGDS